MNYYERVLLQKSASVKVADERKEKKKESGDLLPASAETNHYGTYLGKKSIDRAPKSRSI